MRSTFSIRAWRPVAHALVIAPLLTATAPLSIACAREARASTHHAVSATGFVDRAVTYRAGGVTIDGIYRGPRGGGRRVPAVLLIAGSGPTDENGNSPEIHGQVNTLRTLADWLSADGVATLRYDKLGSGTTGLGPYAANPAKIGIAPFEQEAAAGLRFLAAQPGVDRARLGVFGHSEGALFALLAATGHGGGLAVPHVHALGLLEPLSLRYLDLITVQVRAQITAAVRAGEITASEGATIAHALRAAIAQLRGHGTVPTGLPGNLNALLNADDARFLREADRYDPAALGGSLPAGMPVLTSCSNDDIQVSCAEVARLDAGLRRAHVALDAVQLTGVDHVLKVDPSRTATHYGDPLPFSPALRQAIARFVHRSL